MIFLMQLNLGSLHLCQIHCSSHLCDLAWFCYLKLMTFKIDVWVISLVFLDSTICGWWHFWWKWILICHILLRVCFWKICLVSLGIYNLDLTTFFVKMNFDLPYFSHSLRLTHLTDLAWFYYLKLKVFWVYRNFYLPYLCQNLRPSRFAGLTSLYHLELKTFLV